MHAEGDEDYHAGLVRNLFFAADRSEELKQNILGLLAESQVYVLLTINDCAGPSSKDTKQVVREIHILVSTALEEELSENPSCLDALARNSFAGGARISAQAVEHCSNAASLACETYRFSDASKFIANAIECSKYSSDTSDFKLKKQELEIQAEMAHVGGGNRQTIAEKLWTAVNSSEFQADDRILFLAGRASYDAAAGSGDQILFSNAFELGQRLSDGAKTLQYQLEGLHLMAISAPPTEREKREELLSDALAIISKESISTNNDLLLLKSHLLNSLAEILSQSTDEDKERANKLFLESISIKEDPNTMDLPGLARSWGGVGRLHMFRDKPDYDQAIAALQKDLDISEEIGDQMGESKMHSLIGNCKKSLCMLPEAITHYRKSLDLAESPIDKTFALLGMLSISVQKEDSKEFAGFFQEFTKLRNELGGIPQPCLLTQEEIFAAATDRFGADIVMSN
ncbi:MAG: hypothetical protein R8M38_05535 [Mariprofundaceae bacterium]